MKQWMWYVLGKSDDFAVQFVIGSVIQFLEVWQTSWAISMTADAVDHRVNSLKVRRPSETTPRTGGIRKACDDDSTVHVVKCYIINPMRTQDTHRLRCLRTRRHQPLDMLGDRQIISDAYAQDLRAVAQCYSR